MKIYINHLNLDALPQLLTSATPSVVCSGASVNLNATNAVIAPGTATSGNGINCYQVTF